MPDNGTLTREVILLVQLVKYDEAQELSDNN